ncbi:interleukin-17 receptor E-like protein [Aplochiton taeniatus]
MERIQTCGTRCPKGLPCKSKPHYSFSPCRSQPTGLDISVLSNVSLSTVMSCRGKQQCSLHLQVHMFLQLNEHHHGVSICTVTAGMLDHCTLISFPRATKERLAGQRVEIQSDCFDVGPGQDIHVILKSVPSYCGVTWTNTYHVPECHDEDLQRNVPECISGRLSYTVDHSKNELSVSVSDMLDGTDYHLRLCYKGYICRDTGDRALVKKEERVKNATLAFSRPLPCLCIEGWSATLDAPRVQVCPFKDRLEELWTGVNFDPVEETLSWQAACSVAAVVSLCQLEEGGVCENLPNASLSAAREKIFFSKVDPHPRLCMKVITFMLLPLFD